jgi:hypothetical protein
MWLLLAFFCHSAATRRNLLLHFSPFIGSHDEPFIGSHDELRSWSCF